MNGSRTQLTRHCARLCACVCVCVCVCVSYVQVDKLRQQFSDASAQLADRDGQITALSTTITDLQTSLKQAKTARDKEAKARATACDQLAKITQQLEKEREGFSAQLAKQQESAQQALQQQLADCAARLRGLRMEYFRPIGPLTAPPPTTQPTVAHASTPEPPSPAPHATSAAATPHTPLVTQGSVEGPASGSATKTDSMRASMGAISTVTSLEERTASQLESVVGLGVCDLTHEQIMRAMESYVARQQVAAQQAMTPLGTQHAAGEAAPLQQSPTPPPASHQSHLHTPTDTPHTATSHSAQAAQDTRTHDAGSVGPQGGEAHNDPAASNVPAISSGDTQSFDELGRELLWLEGCVLLVLVQLRQQDRGGDKGDAGGVGGSEDKARAAQAAAAVAAASQSLAGQMMRAMASENRKLQQRLSALASQVGCHAGTHTGAHTRAPPAPNLTRTHTNTHTHARARAHAHA